MLRAGIGDEVVIGGEFETDRAGSGSCVGEEFGVERHELGVRRKTKDPSGPEAVMSPKVYVYKAFTTFSIEFSCSVIQYVLDAGDCLKASGQWPVVSGQLRSTCSFRNWSLTTDH